MVFAAAPAGAATPADPPAFARAVRALAAIAEDYVVPVDLDAVVERGLGAIRDRAKAEPAAFGDCMAARSSSRPRPEGSAGPLLDALECTKSPAGEFDEIMDSALKAMVAGLDPLSYYYEPAEYRALYESEGAGHVGLRLVALDGGFTVIGTDPSTPARAAGIEEGERLLAVGGAELSGRSIDQVMAMLRGTVGSEVVLTLVPRGGGRRELALARVAPDGRMELEAETRDGVLILHVHRLGRGLGTEFGKALGELAEPPRGVVLDLRSNLGGLLDKAVWLADSFLDEGRIVESRGRRKRGETYRARKGQALPETPLVVLVNGATAAGAEIVAAALQDNKRAKVVGAATMGAGTVQTLMPIDRDRAIRLTTAFEYRADGRRLQDSPVVPDCLIPQSGEPALAAAVALVLGDDVSCAAPPASAARSR
jgi:carboxyl-terminal processing protease